MLEFPQLQCTQLKAWQVVNSFKNYLFQSYKADEGFRVTNSCFSWSNIFKDMQRGISQHYSETSLKWFATSEYRDCFLIQANILEKKKKTTEKDVRKCSLGKQGRISAEIFNQLTWFHSCAFKSWSRSNAQVFYIRTNAKVICEKNEVFKGLRQAWKKTSAKGPLRPYPQAEVTAGS